MPKLISLSGWQTISPVKPHLLRETNFFSPFGDDHSEIEISPRLKKPPVTGWCSWYAFGLNITADKILANARFLANHHSELPLEYILIDDGYCLWGDWQTVNPKKFPAGLQPVFQEITTLGFKKGLWWAPFVVDVSSILAQKNPDWLLRHPDGRIVDSHNSSDLVPDFLFHRAGILDLENEDVWHHLFTSLDFLIYQYSPDLLKVDFLGAIYFDPRLKSAHEAENKLTRFYRHLRQKYPHLYLLSATAPLKIALQYSDAIKISADNVLPQLDNFWPINALINGTLLKQLSHNLEARFSLREVCNLDPDAFVCRKNLGLNDDQIRSLGDLVKRTQGLFFLGDDLPSLPPERIAKFIKPLFSGSS